MTRALVLLVLLCGAAITPAPLTETEYDMIQCGSDTDCESREVA